MAEMPAASWRLLNGVFTRVPSSEPGHVTGYTKTQAAWVSHAGRNSFQRFESIAAQSETSPDYVRCGFQATPRTSAGAFRPLESKREGDAGSSATMAPLTGKART
jgi:hypothetical protein